MYFDDPIYLDRSSFEDLMVDTDQHRICWMYHDILSHPRIAWMFDKYAGKGTPIREAWTTMAWVAAGHQEDSFYLLFKWYEDFFDPPQRSDLYFLQREEGPEGEVRVRFLNRDFQNKLDLRDRAWCESFPSRVSQNASYFFGETKFDSNPVGRILQLLDANPGRELECFDWHFGRRSMGRSPCCVPPFPPISAACKPSGKSCMGWWTAMAGRRGPPPHAHQHVCTETGGPTFAHPLQADQAPNSMANSSRSSTDTRFISRR